MPSYTPLASRNNSITTESLGAIDDFITNCSSADSLDDILSCLRIEMNRLGFEKFSYQLVNKPLGFNGRLYITCYPQDWAAHYIKEKYISHDVVCVRAMQTTQPFVWHDVVKRIKLTANQKKLFSEASEFGINVGATVPIHGYKGTMATFSVSNCEKEQEFSRLFLRHRHELQLIATYAHECILSLGLQQKKQEKINLSPSEVESLTWTAQGKSAWEIGMIMGITEPTVKFHLSNACAKLDASNKTHAVVVALLNGLIAP